MGDGPRPVRNTGHAYDNADGGAGVAAEGQQQENTLWKEKYFGRGAVKEKLRLTTDGAGVYGGK